MECRSPCLEEHRENMENYADEDVLDELERAWEHPRREETGDWQRQDWSTFRAITLREARRRGLDLSVTKARR